MVRRRHGFSTTWQKRFGIRRIGCRELPRVCLTALREMLDFIRPVFHEPSNRLFNDLDPGLRDKQRR